MTIATTSDKLKIALELADGETAMPRTALKAVTVALKSLIPEVEELERRLAERQEPRDAAPSPLDEFRKRQQDLRDRLQESVVSLRKDLAAGLRDAAQALNPED